jgi:hypothetical protein
LLAYGPVRQVNPAMKRGKTGISNACGCWQIVFAANETNSHVPYEATVPSALSPSLERYLAVHRPVLMRGEQADG